MAKVFWIVLLQISIFGSQGLAAEVPVADFPTYCSTMFDPAELRLPAGWSVDPGSAETIYKGLPIAEKPLLWGLARTAEFVDRFPSSTFQDLGTIASFDMNVDLQRIRDEIAGKRNSLPSSFPKAQWDVEMDRLMQLDLALRFNGAYPFPVEPSLVAGLRSYLQGAPTPRSFDPSQRLSSARFETQGLIPDESAAFLKTFYEKWQDELPDLRTFILHSEDGLNHAVMESLMFVFQNTATEDDFEQLSLIAQKRVRGEPVRVSGRLQFAFQKFEQIRKGESAEDRRMQWRVFKFSVAKMIQEFIELHAPNDPPTDSIRTFILWGVFLQQETLLDQGWNPFLRALFVELVMDRRTVTGRHMKFIMKRNLEHHIQSIIEGSATN